ncbi:MAG: hypothetical protein GY755_16350 [Chloroflexi bacterium]|nr:hypothetical protein [Chloroflexota bacterium]
MMKSEIINYRGWENSIRLFNEQVDLVILTAVGPRIIRYGYKGEENIFAELSETIGQSGGENWNLYGGHRLSHGPEDRIRSRVPDNLQVDYEQIGEAFRVTQPVEVITGIQKELEISLDASSTIVTIVHRLYNRNLWDIQCAPWALSVMRTGGRSIVPLPPRRMDDAELQHNGSISLWAYTNMADPRWGWGHRYVTLTQHSSAETFQKAGFWVPDGWAAYHYKNTLFIKQMEVKDDKAYPDNHVNVELFTNHELLEVESLGPLAQIEAGGCLEHIETWTLHHVISELKSENEIQQNLIPLL